MVTRIINFIEEFLSRKVKIAVGSAHSLILLESGQVLATGRNGNGQLGSGNCFSRYISVLVNWETMKRTVNEGALLLPQANVIV